MPGFFVCLRRTVCPTPTCVGNTTCSPCSGTTTAVHPHMRGEYTCPASCSTGKAGSSPHAWGIRTDKLVPYSAARFIPTCVGNTWWKTTPSRGRTVHPHMRGEYLLYARLAHDTGGSSPHAWGIRRGATAVQRHSRFIPTCVGNTGCGGCRWQRNSVHPHMRGEYAA